MRAGRGSLLRNLSRLRNHEWANRLTKNLSFEPRCSPWEWNFIPVAIGNACQQNRSHSNLTPAHFTLPHESSLARSGFRLLSLARFRNFLVPRSSNRKEARRSLATDGHVMSSKGDRPFTIVVEGNIGSGKTTLLQHFAALSTPAAPFETLQEPVSKWRDVKGHNTLGLMYDDPKRWSLTFQTYVQLTMVDLHARKTQKPNAIKMMERSIYSAKYCFVENLRKNGIMPEVEYTVLTEWFDWLIANQSCEVDLIIYLKTCPENVYDRIQERGRDEEMDITLDYLISLHRLHENWLMPKMCAADYVDHPNPAWFPVPAPVMIFDGDMRVHEIGEQIEQRMEEILEKRRAKMGRSSLARLPPAGTKSAPIELEEEGEEDEDDSQNQERGASSSKRRVKDEDDSAQGRRKYSRKAKVLKVLN